jgi:hypothetical protein
VSAPSGTQIRFPVAPGGAVPEGARPIPATTQTNKKTNAQIPYMRRAYEVRDVGGVFSSAVAEGSICLVERQQLVPRASGYGPNRMVDVYSVESVNAAIAAPRDAPMTYEEFPYRVDGVVNNVDGEDLAHEFRDSAIVNVAVQGPCRLDHRAEVRADDKHPRPGSVIYVGCFATRSTPTAKWVHRLERFSSGQITRGVANLGADPWEPNPLRLLLFAWTIGRVIDPSQSKEMLSVHVSVCPVRALRRADAQPYQPRNAAAGNLSSYVLQWMPSLAGSVPAVFGAEVPDKSVKEQLLGMWLDAERFQAYDAARATAAKPPATPGDFYAQRAAQEEPEFAPALPNADVSEDALLG